MVRPILNADLHTTHSKLILENKQKQLLPIRTETNRLTSIKNWLRNNLEPFDEILQRWSDSWLLRVTSIIKEAEINKSNILQEWPRLADPNGYLLVSTIILFVAQIPHD